MAGSVIYDGNGNVVSSSNTGSSGSTPSGGSTPSSPSSGSGGTYVLPADLSANSLNIVPTSGSSTPSAITQKNAGGTTTFATDTAGNVSAQGVTTVGDILANGKLTAVGQSTLAAVQATNVAASGTLNVQGASTLAGLQAASAAVTGNASVGGTFNVVGATTLAALTAVNLAASGTLNVQGASTLAALSAASATIAGNQTVGGTLGVSGTATLAALQATSSTVTGNATVGGTLGVTGATTLGSASMASATVSGNATIQGTASVTGSLASGPLTASSSNITGNETVGGTLGVSGATNVAALTASGLITAPNLTLTSGGKVTFPDGTTLATAPTATASSASSGSGAGSLDTIYMGVHSAASGNYPTTYTAQNGYFVNTQLQGSTTITTGSAYYSPYAGAIYSIEVFAVSASQPISVCLYKNGVATSLVATSTTAGGGFSAQPSSPISVAVGDLLQLFVKGATASMSNSLIGWCTVQQANGGSANNTRTAIDMGGYTYGTNSAGGFSATKKYNGLAGSTGAGSNQDLTIRMPFAGSIVGYSLQQSSTSGGANSIIYSKNGTNFAAISVGSGAGTFNGAHAVTAYPFAAGDKIQLLTSIANGGSTDVVADIFVQWTDAASAATGVVTNDPSFNSLKLAAVSGDTNPVALTFGDNTVQSTAATMGRCVIDLGAYGNTNTNNSFWTTTWTAANNTSGGTVNINSEAFFKSPFPFTVVGWELHQYVANGQNSFQICKNRNANSGVVPFINVANAGNATISGFPGQQFTGTFARGTYNFAAGDSMSAVVAFASGVSTNMKLLIWIEWL